VRKKSSDLIFLLILVLPLLVLRLAFLAEKPVHHDESINGWFVMQMWTQGFFKYDPANYHGPLLFYLFQWAEVLFGSSIETLRGVTGVFSVLTLTLFAQRVIQNRSTAFLLGLLIVTLSPAAEFFARSAIHESVYVFFMALTLFSIYFSRPLALALMGVVGMVLLKETWILWLISGSLAFVLAKAWQDSDLVAYFQLVKADLVERHKLFSILGWAAVVITLFYTGFLQNPKGLVDFFQAFLPWTKTGVSGAGHEKPWWTWLEWLWLYEVPTLAMLLVSLVGMFLKDRRVRFFCILAVTHFALYSLIPYKTPWCFVSLQLPLVFSGVVSLENIFRHLNSRSKKAGLTALFALCLIPLPQLWRLTFASPIQMDHPYVYVQTHYDVKLMIEHLERAKEFLSTQKIQIATAENWPFPWLLRQYPLLSFAPAKSEPEVSAALLIFDEDQAERIRFLLAATHWERTLMVRQSRVPAVVFIRNDLIDKIGKF